MIHWNSASATHNNENLVSATANLLNIMGLRLIVATHSSRASIDAV